MATVQKAGEKFTFNGRILTAQSFFGKTGIEYPTAAEAKQANQNGSIICVKNVEYGGATDLAVSMKI